MNLQLIILILGIAGALTLVYFAFAGPNVQKAGARRLSAVKIRHSDSEQTQLEKQFRKAVASRKPLPSSGEGKRSLQEKIGIRLSQTGKTWTVKQYMMISGGAFVAVFLALSLVGAPILLRLFGAILIGIGIPHMVVGMAIKRRVNKFVKAFPDAIDLLVRGLRSGLPVTETMGLAAKEIPGPVGEEFKIVTERMAIGRTMEDALGETAQRLNNAEFNFFCITLSIQRETGGNLAETLNNLSAVLRGRSQMKLKIKALSSESKASAYIVGSLPFIVFGLVWTMNPEYLMPFFYEDRLIVAGLGGLGWMGIGVFIMYQMMNFEI